MDDDASYDLRVYAEGIRLPAYGVTRTQQTSQPLSFRVRIPPIPKAFSVLPNTTVHTFVRRDDGTNESKWVLFTEGRVKERRLQSSKSGGLATVLQCKGLSADWDEVNMGFNVGNQEKLLDSKKTNFFYGFSTGDKDQEEPFPGFKAGRGGAFLNKFNSQGSKFLSFKASLDRYMSKGPVQAAVSILASMPAFSPIFRRNYNALQLQNRIGYVENTRITKWLKSKNVQNILRQRIRSFRPNTSLFDLIRYVLRESFHKMTPLASPPLRTKKNEDEKTEDVEKSPEREPEVLGEGDTWKTSPNASIPELYKDPRVKSYLDIIARTEHRTKDVNNKDLYRRQFGYGAVEGRTFSLAEGGHPGEFFNVEGQELDTSAAGKFQITYTTWKDFTSQYSFLNRNDFGEKSQDLAAVAILKKEGAIKPILNNNIAEANAAASNRWASLPGVFGESVFENQSAPLNHVEIGVDYNTFLRRNLYDTGGSVPEATVEGDAIDRSVEVPGTLPTVAITPTLRDSPAPVCNVIMPSDIESIQVGDSFEKAPTRMMMQRNQTYQKLGSSNLAQAIRRNTVFSPRRFAYMVRHMDEGGKFEDIQKEGAKEAINSVLEENFDQPPVDDLDEISKETWKKLKQVREVRKITDPEGSTDMFSAVMSGETPLPQNLLSLYTLDELFRGVHPVVGQFPFPGMGGDDDSSGEAAYAESEVIEQIRENNEIISEITPLTSDEAKKADKNRQKAQKKREETNTLISASSLWGDYQLAMQRRKVRTCSFKSPLNLDIAVGFPMALNHPAIGWVEGTVNKVRDTINVQQNSATTSVSMTFCKFHVDYENDTWRHIEMESDGDANALSEGGLPSRPIFYGEEFEPDNIGETLYQDILQVGSVVDLAKKLGAEEPTPREALAFLFKKYEESDRPRQWIRRYLTRPMATENQVFNRAIGAEADESYFEDEVDDTYYGDSPDKRDWGTTYPVYQMPEEGVFIEERAQWARSLRETLREKNFAIDATFNSEED